MNKFRYVLLITAIFTLINLSSAEVPEDDRPKSKPPKSRTVNELVKIRTKNIKKTKGDVAGILKFRSSDFDQQYFIGGQVQSYVENVVNILIEGLKADFPQLYQTLINQVKVYVVYDRTLNAHATRNNNILLTSQWLKDAESEGEIAAVLAHELSHIILVHPDTNTDRTQQQKSLKKFVGIASMVTTLANLKSKSSGNSKEIYLTKKGEKEVSQALLLGSFMNDIKLHYINTKVSRKNEEQADYLAVDLLKLSNFPTGMSRQMLELLYDDESKNEEALSAAESYLDLVGPFFQQWLAKELTKIAGDDILKQAVAVMIHKFGAKVANKVSHWIQEKRRTHLRAKTRYFRVDDYLDEYDLDESPPTQENNFNNIKNTVTAIYDEFELLELANNNIDLKQYRKAEKLINQVSASIKNKNPELYLPVNIKMWVLRSKLRIAQRQYIDAIENLCHYTLKFENKDCFNENFSEQADHLGIHIPQDLFVLLAESYIHLQDNLKAHNVIESGTSYADKQPFHLHKVMLACNERKYVAFSRSLKQCKKSIGFNTAKSCDVIENHLEVLQSAAEKELQESQSFSFGSVKHEQLDWWTACDEIKSRPFSTIKTTKEVKEIKQLADLLTETRKNRLKEENEVNKEATL